MYIAILGRQPAISIAELERVFGEALWFSPDSALVQADRFIIERLGGTQKAGRVVLELPSGDWRRVSLQIVRHYVSEWSGHDGKITLGISAYGFNTDVRDIQKTGLVLKNKLKTAGVSLRLIPNADPALNTATSHHNKLGLSANKVELIIVKASNGRIVVAESVGAQNITALAARDQGRPKRDAFVGMLPPKLAQIMVNLGASPLSSGSGHGFDSNLQPRSEPTPGLDSDLERSPAVKSVAEQSELPRILDPFCGTGVILQEAALMRYGVYGTDLSEKMIRFSRDNLNWLQDTTNVHFDWFLHEGDAMTVSWQQPIDAVVAESYLGQPFSAPPSSSKLVEVRGNCNHIITEFLVNIAQQIKPGTPLCIAVPAWRSTDGSFTHLPLIGKLGDLGFKEYQFTSVRPDQLLYFREGQVVARELLVLIRK